MTRAITWAAAAILAASLAACGTNNITDELPPTSTPTVTNPPPTAAATATPVATVVQPATALLTLDATDPANPFPSDRLLDSTGHVQVPAA